MAGADARTASASLKPWCSATFVGARHSLELVLAGEDAGARAVALAATLVDAEFRIAGHIVADVAVDGIVHATEEARLQLAILTIEDW